MTVAVPVDVLRTLVEGVGLWLGGAPPPLLDSSKWGEQVAMVEGLLPAILETVVQVRSEHPEAAALADLAVPLSDVEQPPQHPRTIGLLPGAEEVPIANCDAFEALGEFRLIYYPQDRPMHGTYLEICEAVNRIHPTVVSGILTMLRRANLEGHYGLVRVKVVTRTDAVVVLGLFNGTGEHQLLPAVPVLPTEAPPDA